MPVDFRMVRLPEDLCLESENWMNGRFESLEALITFLLQEVVKTQGRGLDQKEEEMIQQRLRDLGYI